MVASIVVDVFEALHDETRVLWNESTTYIGAEMNKKTIKLSLFSHF